MKHNVKQFFAKLKQIKIVVLDPDLPCDMAVKSIAAIVLHKI